MIWSFIILGALLCVGATGIWMELRHIPDPQRRLLSGACVRCGRDTTNEAWCPDCADHLYLP